MTIRRAAKPPTASDGVREVEMREERRDEEIEKSLSAIYEDESGKMPDMRVIEPAHRQRSWYIFVGAASMLTLLLAVAWLGFLFLKPMRGFSGQALSVIIEGPEQISLGQETTYFINYQNRASEPLAMSEIRVSFPPDFVIHETSPAPTSQGLVWRLGSQAAGERGTLRIRGAFTGALGTITAIQAVGSYRPASFNSDFETLTTKALRYTDTVLEGSLSVPPKVMPGDQVNVAYHLRNKGVDPLSNLKARIILPEGFERDVGSNVAFDGRAAIFSLGELMAGASSTFRVVGAFAAGASGEELFVAEAGREAADGTFQQAEHSEATSTVLAGDLSLNLVINGSNGDQAVKYGGPLRLALSYENTATEELKDVTVRVRFEPASSIGAKNLIDWSHAEVSASGTRQGNSLIWNKDQVAALGRLPPGNEGQLEIAASMLPASAGTSSLAVRVILEAEIGAVGNTKVNRIVRASPIVLSYLSDASLFAEARYFTEEGAPQGSGPLPPVSGQTTAYRVRWTVLKKFHPLTNVRVTATLPKIAGEPTNAQASHGDVSVDPVARMIVWNASTLPQDVQEASLEFDLPITPSDADIGRFAQLLGETRLEATDGAVKQTIILTRPALNTDLQNDESAKGKGVVKKP